MSKAFDFKSSRVDLQEPWHRAVFPNAPGFVDMEDLSAILIGEDYVFILVLSFY
jgi:hypothetical protein